MELKQQRFFIGFKQMDEPLSLIDVKGHKLLLINCSHFAHAWLLADVTGLGVSVLASALRGDQVKVGECVFINPTEEFVGNFKEHLEGIVRFWVVTPMEEQLEETFEEKFQIEFLEASNE